MLARFAATLDGACTRVYTNRNSGSAWTLEWMLLPQLCIATGAASGNGEKLLKSLEWMGTPAS